MPNVVFIADDGTQHSLNLGIGTSVMQGAVSNDIPGIIGECGGAAACATCRVHIEPDWAKLLPPPEPFEAAMLEDYGNESGDLRLACQIRITIALDGLTVRIPASQR
jgi:2Fe-2S ferredoxin